MNRRPEHTQRHRDTAQHKNTRTVHVVRWHLISSLIIIQTPFRSWPHVQLANWATYKTSSTHTHTLFYLQILEFSVKVRRKDKGEKDRRKKREKEERERAQQRAWACASGWQVRPFFTKPAGPVRSLLLWYHTARHRCRCFLRHSIWLSKYTSYT